MIKEILKIKIKLSISKLTIRAHMMILQIFSCKTTKELRKEMSH